MTRATFAAAAIAALAAGPAGAQMYKCVDEQGRVTYSEVVRPGCKAGTIDVRPIPRTSGNPAPATDDMKQREIDFRRRQIDRAKVEAAEKEEADKALAAKREKCNGLKDDLLTLDSRQRIVLDVNHKGERVYMDDAMRAKALAEIRERLRTECQ